MRVLTACIGLWFLSILLYAQDFKSEWESLDSREIPVWFENAKFGIFIHWGVYSVPAFRPLQEGLYNSYAEWYYARVYKNIKTGGKTFHDTNYGKNFEYRDFAPMFRAELWDPDSWAQMFLDAGAKYVVLTSKHHDGFCLWPTKSPYKKNWNSMDIGPHRDLVGDLTIAVKNAGMKMGLYYSIPEWESSKTHREESGYSIPLDHVEKYKIPEDEYVDKHLIPQLKELVNNYKPSLIFSDAGEWDGTDKQWKTKEFLRWLYNESPVKNEIVVNDRFAKGMPGNHGDYYSSEYKDASFSEPHPWEESRGIGSSYGFNRAENLEHYSSSEDLILELIDLVSRGGNLLLNVGPTADGRIPVIMQQRLKDIGDWLSVNGDAIYGTRPVTNQLSGNPEQKLFFTQKAKNLYIIFTDWSGGKLELNINKDIIIDRVTMLGHYEHINWEKRADKLFIELPQIYISDIPCSYAWTLRITIE